MKIALVAFIVFALSFSTQAFDAKLSTQALARIRNYTQLARIYNPKDNNTDYKKAFGNNYVFAENFIKKHSKIKTELIKAGINPDFAISIVFPELIRYSSILNIAETSALKTLYIQHGKDHIDFSIGYFQMKPSFAEEIEKYANTMAGLEVYDISDTPEARKKRIHRLDSLDGQLKYLILFVKIMENKTATQSNLQTDWLTANTRIKNPSEQIKTSEQKMQYESEKLKYFATAYNCGFTNTESYIKKKIPQKHFTTDFFTDENTTYYCYSAIAAWWFDEIN